MIPQWKEYRVDARHAGIKRGAASHQIIKARSALGALRFVQAADRLEGRKMDYKVKPVWRDS